MAKNEVEVKLNWDGVGKLLRSKEIKEECVRQASEIKNRCGEGYETGSYLGEDRQKATIYPATNKAKKDNLKNNTILKALK